MLIIEVFEKIHQRKITKKDGSAFTITYQEAEILRQGKRPKPLEVTVPRSGAYIKGLYTLTGSSFRPDDFDRLALAPYIRLEPLNDAITGAEAANKSKKSASNLTK